MCVHKTICLKSFPKLNITAITLGILFNQHNHKYRNHTRKKENHKCIIYHINSYLYILESKIFGPIQNIE